MEGHSQSLFLDYSPRVWPIINLFVSDYIVQYNLNIIIQFVYFFFGRLYFFSYNHFKEHGGIAIMILSERWRDLPDPLGTVVMMARNDLVDARAFSIGRPMQ
jgi:hypothetical protein